MCTSAMVNKSWKSSRTSHCRSLSVLASATASACWLPEASSGGAVSSLRRSAEASAACTLIVIYMRWLKPGAVVRAFQHSVALLIRALCPSVDCPLFKPLPREPEGHLTSNTRSITGVYSIMDIIIGTQGVLIGMGKVCLQIYTTVPCIPAFRGQSCWSWEDTGALHALQGCK